MKKTKNILHFLAENSYILSWVTEKIIDFFNAEKNTLFFSCGKNSLFFRAEKNICLIIHFAQKNNTFFLAEKIFYFLCGKIYYFLCEKNALLFRAEKYIIFRAEKILYFSFGKNIPFFPADKYTTSTIPKRKISVWFQIYAYMSSVWRIFHNHNSFLPTSKNYDIEFL